MKRATNEAEQSRARTAARRPSGTRRWLLFVHQLPSSPSNIRVRTWRRLQQLGAVVVKQAVYVLPDTADSREDFEWLRTEIEAAGGHANVFAADTVDTWSDDALVNEFRRERQAAYEQLAREIETVTRRRPSRLAKRSRRKFQSQRVFEGFRQRLAAIERIDFFGSAGRDRVAMLLDQAVLAEQSSEESHGQSTEAYQQRLWVTRPRPGVDRMASAWFIRRFVDSGARFDFVKDRGAAPRDAIPFDMFGVELSHHGDHCTFETLSTVFSIHEPAISRIAAIVHDLDVKDARFGAPEAGTVGAMIEGLQLAYPDDDVLLEQGMTIFESLYRSFERAARVVGPRPLAKPRQRKTTRSRSALRRRRSPSRRV
jgi:hypothetical protein